MAGTITLTDGVISIPLVYNAASQPAYRLQYGGRLQLQPTQTIEHAPDTAAPCPVIGWDTDRTFFFNLDVGADTPNAPYNCQGWDSPLDALIALKRLVDGANQQALRYWTDGDVREVLLQTQLDGSSNIVSHSVKLGFVDDGGAFYDQWNKSEIGFDVVVSLRVAPYGQGSTFTLNNALGGAPGMMQGGALATGLSVVGTPSNSIDTDIYLMGGRSQKIITDTSTAEGFETGLVTLAGATDIIGYVWLYIEAGGDAVTVALVTDIGTIQSAVLTVNDDNAVSDQKATDAQGNTWYRVPVGGTTLPATNVKLVVQRVLSPSVATTFYADMLYIALNETVQPLGWAGVGASMQNDGAVFSNHLDVSGIAGDIDALVTHKVTISNTTLNGTRNFTVSRGIDGKYLIAQQPHWQDSADYLIGSGTTTGTGVWSTVGGGSGGNHVQYSSGGAGETGTISATISGDDARKFLATTRRVFARLSASTLAIDFSFSVATPAGIFNGAPNDVNAINQFELVDLGLLNGKSILPDTPPDTALPDVTFTIAVTGFAGAGELARIDGLYFLYADDDFLLGQTLEDLDDTDEIWIVGNGEYVTTSPTGQKEPRVLGSAWSLATGTTSNRIVYTWAQSDNLHELLGVVDVVLEVTPQTRHLLGTI